MKIDVETPDNDTVKVTVQWHPAAEFTTLGDGLGSPLLDAAMLLEVGHALGQNPDKQEGELIPLPRVTVEAKVAELEKRLKLIQQRFDRYCLDGLELAEGETYLGGELTGRMQPLFDSLYKAIKDA